MSTAPAAVCLLGKVNRYVGSHIDNLGYKNGVFISSFSQVASLVITAPQFISEPVAHMVSTTAIGKADFTRDLSRTKSHGEPS